MPDAWVPTEAEFQAAVIEVAELCGWMVFHAYDSRRSAGPGFPDLVLARRGRVVFAELKSARGRVMPAQERWLDALAPRKGQAAAHEVFVWRAGDDGHWKQIEATLR